MASCIDWIISIVKPIKSNPEIIRKNLEIMNSNQKGGMLQLVNSESIGGNAGYEGDYPCLGTGFFYDPETGGIKIFGNIQNIPNPIRKKYRGAIFRIAMDLKTQRYRILSVSYDQKVNAYIKQTMQDSITLYNQKYGFKMQSN